MEITVNQNERNEVTMAEYFTQFSESIAKLSPDEKAWVEEELTAPLERTKCNQEAYMEQWHKDHPLDDPECWPRFDWSFEGDVLWISSDESGSPDHVGIFVQRFLAEWRQEAVFSMTWSSTCSRLLVGAFSGGWLVVTKDKIVYGNAFCEAEQAVQALKNGASSLPEAVSNDD